MPSHLLLQSYFQMQDVQTPTVRNSEVVDAGAAAPTQPPLRTPCGLSVVNRHRPFFLRG